MIFGQHALFISLNPNALGMFVSKSVAAGYETLKTISDIAKSCKIIRVSQDNFTPVLRMIVEKPFPDKAKSEIIISFYHEAPNFSIKTEHWQKNIFTRFIEKRPKASILDFADEDIVMMSVEEMVKNIDGLDIRMAEAVNAQSLKRLKSILRDKDVCPKLISVVPLSISLFADEDAREFPNFNELFLNAINEFSEELDKKDAEQKKRLHIRRLKRRVERLRKKLLKPEEIEHFRTLGELILTSIARIGKGASSVELVDPYIGKKVEVKLDPRLTPQANAQKYFSRYKKEKRGQPKLRAQIAGLEKEMAATYAIRDVKPGEKKELGRLVRRRDPFHKFNLDSGSVVFVGKSARSNDQLTFQQARPNDYFFHVRGVEGAHTILRPSMQKGQRPRRDDIETAASIAAYFSKARTQHRVPVSYTQRKYLKKAKRGKPGTVILMREEVVFVDPALPH